MRFSPSEEGERDEARAHNAPHYVIGAHLMPSLSLSRLAAASFIILRSLPGRIRVRARVRVCAQPSSCHFSHSARLFFSNLSLGRESTCPNPPRCGEMLSLSLIRHLSLRCAGCLSCEMCAPDLEGPSARGRFLFLFLARARARGAIVRASFVGAAILACSFLPGIVWTGLIFEGIDCHRELIDLRLRGESLWIDV